MSNPQNEGIILFHRFISIEAFAASPGSNELTNLDTYENNIHDNLYLFFSSKSRQIGKPTTATQFWTTNLDSKLSVSGFFGAESKLRKTDVSEHRNCLQLSNSKNDGKLFTGKWLQCVVQGCSSCPSTWM